MGFSRQEYWSGLPFPSSGIKPTSLMSLVGGFFTTSTTWEALLWVGGWVLVALLYPTLCKPMDCSLPGSPVHRILQARIMEWVTIPFSRGSSQPRDRTQVLCIADRFFTTWATREALLERAKSKTLTITNASEKVKWRDCHTLQRGVHDDTTT